MAYVCLGFSHHSTPLELREKLIVESSELHRSFCNFVLLSTCNRVEIYTTTDSASVRHQNGDTAFELLQLVSKCCNININQLNQYASLYFDTEAAHHLFRVAAGLKSQIVGEPQILGQVSQALKQAESRGSVNSSLRRLFRRAVKAGRRVRTQTRIGHHSCSFATISVKLATNHLGDIAGKNVLLLGAGSVATSLVNQFGDVGSISIISRSMDSAQQLAARSAQCRPFPVSETEQQLVEADVVVASTSAHQILIDRQMVDRAIAARSDRPMLIVDLAVPRNVATDVEDVAGVRRFDIEDLNSIVEESLEKRLLEVPLVEKILYEELSHFLARSEGKAVDTTIVDWRRKLEDIRISELTRIQTDDALESRVCELLEQFSIAFLERILREPTKRMRYPLDPILRSSHANAINELFDLDADQPFPWSSIESDLNGQD